LDKNWKLTICVWKWNNNDNKKASLRNFNLRLSSWFYFFIDLTNIKLKGLITGIK